MRKILENKNSNTIKKAENIEEQKKSARRAFIKKAAYVAPTLIALGTLTKGTDAHSFETPPSAPEWTN